MNIIGLDIGRGSVVACVLPEKPRSLKTHLRLNRGFHPFEANRQGINELMALEFDIAILEPTGGHYSRIWAEHIQQSGKVVLWVGHQAIANYRKAHLLPSKNDKADALALASYGHEHLGMDEFFIPWPYNRLRDLYLKLQSLNRARNPLLARIKQQLAHEWPEQQKYKVKRQWLDPNPPSLWQYIAGYELSNRCRNTYPKMLANSIGTGFGEFSRAYAQQICAFEQQEYELEQEIESILSGREFASYHLVFDQYGFGNRLRAAMLGSIYPIARFLDADGSPRVERVISKNGKYCKRNRSLSAFKLSLGMGLIEYQSGDSQSWKPGGPSHVRLELWRWAKTSVVMKPSSAPKAKVLRAYYEDMRERGIKGNVSISRVCARAAKMLFKDLTQKER